MPRVSLAGGPEIAYEETGSGAPIIFSHGLYMNRNMFTPQVDELSPRYRCITWDERAHGETRSSGGFTFWDSADDLVKFMDELGIERAVHVGFSQGGLLGLRAQLRHPDRFAGLVQLSSQAAKLAEDGADAFREIVDRWIDGGTTEEILTFLTDLILGPGVDTSYWRDSWAKLTPSQIREGTDAILNLDDITDRLPEVSSPVLVVHGKADVSTPYERAITVSENVPDSRGLLLIGDAPHAANLSHPKEVNGAISDFLQEIGY
jgi:3-oxoadipate enol-lactonase